MKRLIIATLSTLMLGSLGVPALASEVSYQRLAQNNITNQTQPIDLVFLARQGYFQDQGIPQGNVLGFAFDSGKVTAESLVKAGIAEGRITPETLNDEGYLRSVDYNLSQLTNSN